MGDAGFNPFSAAGITMALPFVPSYLMAQANKPKTVEFIIEQGPLSGETMKS